MSSYKPLQTLHRQTIHLQYNIERALPGSVRLSFKTVSQGSNNTYEYVLTGQAEVAGSFLLNIANLNLSTVDDNNNNTSSSIVASGVRDRLVLFPAVFALRHARLHL